MNGPFLRVYQSPEHAIAYDADELFAGDFWSLTVIVHELLTKTLPFSAYKNQDANDVGRE